MDAAQDRQFKANLEKALNSADFDIRISSISAARKSLIRNQNKKKLLKVLFVLMHQILFDTPTVQNEARSEIKQLIAFFNGSQLYKNLKIEDSVLQEFSTEFEQNYEDLKQNLNFEITGLISIIGCFFVKILQDQNLNYQNQNSAFNILEIFFTIVDETSDSQYPCQFFIPICLNYLDDDRNYHDKNDIWQKILSVLKKIIQHTEYFNIEENNWKKAGEFSQFLLKKLSENGNDQIIDVFQELPVLLNHERVAQIFIEKRDDVLKVKEEEEINGSSKDKLFQGLQLLQIITKNFSNKLLQFGKIEIKLILQFIENLKINWTDDNDTKTEIDLLVIKILSNYVTKLTQSSLDINGQDIQKILNLVQFFINYREDDVQTINQEVQNNYDAASDSRSDDQSLPSESDNDDDEVFDSMKIYEIQNISIDILTNIVQFRSEFLKDIISEFIVNEGILLEKINSNSEDVRSHVLNSLEIIISTSVEIDEFEIRDNSEFKQNTTDFASQDISMESPQIDLLQLTLSKQVSFQTDKNIKSQFADFKWKDIIAQIINQFQSSLESNSENITNLLKNLDSLVRSLGKQIVKDQDMLELIFQEVIIPAINRQHKILDDIEHLFSIINVLFKNYQDLQLNNESEKIFIESFNSIQKLQILKNYIPKNANLFQLMNSVFASNLRQHFLQYQPWLFQIIKFIYSNQDVNDEQIINRSSILLCQFLSFADFQTISDIFQLLEILVNQSNLNLGQMQHVPFSSVYDDKRLSILEYFMRQIISQENKFLLGNEWNNMINSYLNLQQILVQNKFKGYYQTQPLKEILINLNKFNNPVLQGQILQAIYIFMKEDIIKGNEIKQIIIECLNKEIDQNEIFQILQFLVINNQISQQECQIYQKQFFEQVDRTNFQKLSQIIGILQSRQEDNQNQLKAIQEYQDYTDQNFQLHAHLFIIGEISKFKKFSQKNQNKKEEFIKENSRVLINIIQNDKINSTQIKKYASISLGSVAILDLDSFYEAIKDKNIVKYLEALQQVFTIFKEPEQFKKFIELIFRKFDPEISSLSESFLYINSDYVMETFNLITKIIQDKKDQNLLQFGMEILHQLFSKDISSKIKDYQETTIQNIVDKIFEILKNSEYELENKLLKSCVLSVLNLIKFNRRFVRSHINTEFIVEIIPQLFSSKKSHYILINSDTIIDQGGSSLRSLSIQLLDTIIRNFPNLIKQSQFQPQFLLNHYSLFDNINIKQIFFDVSLEEQLQRYKVLYNLLSLVSDSLTDETLKSQLIIPAIKKDLKEMDLLTQAQSTLAQTILNLVYQLYTNNSTLNSFKLILHEFNQKYQTILIGIMSNQVIRN